MAVKIRLKRLGKIRAPYYRVVIMDSRTKRDGRAIEEIGKYHPTREPSVIDIDSERVRYWLGVGAQPTEQVEALLKVTGDWQKFKGLPGAEGTLKPQPVKPSKREQYEAAMAAAGAADDELAKGGPTPRRKPAKVEAQTAPAAEEKAPTPESLEAPTAEAVTDAPVEAVADAPVEAVADAPVEAVADAPAEA
ncbi:MAG: 30S ribosomal protein S16 [Dermatophilaceae bacterium]